MVVAAADVADVGAQVWVGAAADLGEVAVDRALVAGEPHRQALASRGPKHLALLAVLDPVAVLDGLARPREVDLLAYRVAAQHPQRRRRWRLSAYLCAHTALVVCDGLCEEGQLGWRGAVGGCAVVAAAADAWRLR